MRSSARRAGKLFTLQKHGGAEALRLGSRRAQLDLWCSVPHLALPTAVRVPDLDCPPCGRRANGARGSARASRFQVYRMLETHPSQTIGSPDHRARDVFCSSDREFTLPERARAIQASSARGEISYPEAANFIARPGTYNGTQQHAVACLTNFRWSGHHLTRIADCAKLSVNVSARANTGFPADTR